MKNIRLSIIIPFYNVEQYIAQCLDSVYNQDIPEEEYEVICVNDASPDNSREIVTEYQKKHKNLILVEHEVNKKLGAARNTGRRVANGKYIWNVDSDDMITPNCLKEMLDICEKNDLDVLMFRLNVLRDGVLINSKDKPWLETNVVSSGVEFWREQGIKNQGYISPVWTQMYRRAYLDEQQIYSPEINMGEDVPYTYASVLLAKRMMTTNNPYIIYREDEGSLTGHLRKSPKPSVVYENSFVCGAYMYDLLNKIKDVESEVNHSVRMATRYVLNLYTHYILQMSVVERRELRKLCIDNFFSNLFVYKVFTFKQYIYYTRFVMIGKN